MDGGPKAGIVPGRVAGPSTHGSLAAQGKSAINPACSSLDYGIKAEPNETKNKFEKQEVKSEGCFLCEENLLFQSELLNIKI